MKKVITIMCLAAAPILFAQEKSLSASEATSVKAEKSAKEQKKVQEADPHSKVKAEKQAQADKIKKQEINATENKTNTSRSKKTQ